MESHGLFYLGGKMKFILKTTLYIFIIAFIAFYFFGEKAFEWFESIKEQFFVFLGEVF